jgi:hypothetical protein
MRPLIRFFKTSAALTHKTVGLRAISHFLSNTLSPNQGIIRFYCGWIVILSTLSLCIMIVAIVLLNASEHP